MTAPTVRPLRVGILGAGMIATVGYGYLPGLQILRDKVEVVAIADPVIERARAVAQQFSIPHAGAGLDWMLGLEVDAVVNLTPISMHGDTSRAIVESGRHLVTEKPIATTMADADAIIELAAVRGVTVVCSPPHAIHPLIRESRRLIDAGTIGKVALARVLSSHAGPGGSRSRPWGADPTWFYQTGSGPLFDMGVYGIHGITALLGPARRVVALAGITEPTRLVRGGPFDGHEMPVTADDNNLLMLDFGDATFAVVDGSFNVHASRSPEFEIFGRAGTISIPDVIGDPDRQQSRPMEVYRTDALPGLDGWVEPGGRGYLAAELDRFARLGRSVAVEHLADSLATGTAPMLSAEHARHALEIMLAVSTSARSGRGVELVTSFGDGREAMADAS